ncbi:DUF397 domain-containing protein [Streptomyces sp. NPDC057555]|uniref:DUF397 domain-containing protein n=1 Tax=Streptomyces sp. NPDC057555 TaxID=3346166 RepID=UPI0036C1354B
MNETIVRVWRKSSYSGNENACLEILTPPPPGQAPVRDSKDPDDSVIVFRAEAWLDFIAAVRRGEFPI